MLSLRPFLFALVLGGGALAAAVAPALVQDPVEPTEQHAMLQAGAGRWEGTMTMYMPGMEPFEVPARETVEAFGDYWTFARFDADFPGVPYAGRGCFGYDPEERKFVGTWYDVQSPHLAVMEGEWDEAKKALVMRWEAPGASGELVPYRSVRAGDADSYTQTFYLGPGEGRKAMVIEMERVAKAKGDK